MEDFEGIGLTYSVYRREKKLIEEFRKLPYSQQYIILVRTAAYLKWKCKDPVVYRTITVSNIPLGTDKESLRKSLNVAMVACNGVRAACQGNECVISIFLHASGNAEEATNLCVLDGMEFRGVGLRFTRPRYYNTISAPRFGSNPQMDLDGVLYRRGFAV